MVDPGRGDEHRVSEGLNSRNPKKNELWFEYLPPGKDEGQSTGIVSNMGTVDGPHPREILIVTGQVGRLSEVQPLDHDARLLALE